MRATFWSDVLKDRNLVVSTVIMLIRNSLDGLVDNTDVCLKVAVWLGMDLIHLTSGRLLRPQL